MRRRKLVRSFVIAAGLVFGMFQLFGRLGIRISTSPSLPVGIYIATRDPDAKLVEFCPAEPFAALALERGYRDTGVCPDGGTPLLKPVVAQAGDIVELSKNGIQVNGNLVSNTAPLRSDSKGRLLESWPFGLYPVAPGFMWVASSHHAMSFDSRYFGPVPARAIRQRMRPFLTL